MTNIICKAEAVRINKADEQNRLITNQNKTQMKQWKSRISIFIKSVKGWVPFYPLLVTNRNRKFFKHFDFLGIKSEISQ